ncbi:hypothetical protein CC86DRAFT_15570 [Ophiobolus disseminans]|uniref:Only prolin and serin are matching in the corresponding protein n=1 Tax=Ophiobolus disseminans TaxID=1469910 RepID=A0A6A7AKM4_9PLEO|nr:hypothetical protein CC86DRAFT_15570 [Ophiobolus disseminans]
MHELKPLMLPKLVAARKSSQTSLNMSSEPNSSVLSSADSGFYSASECSTPPTPSMHSRGHFRFSSSTSSLSSSPPTHEPIEPPNSSGKLPKLTEEPLEREYDYGNEDPYRCSCDVEPFGHARDCLVSKAYDPENEYFTTHDAELRLAKRRRSLEASAHSIAGKFERRFPSLSRKVRDRNSTLGRVSRSATPSRVPSTRSSSITSSIHHPSVVDLNDSFTSATTPAHASREELDDNATTPMAIDVEKANALVIDPEEIDAERYATTPLLPPLLVNCRSDGLPASSPLQSPTVADATHSLAVTPAGSPPARAYPTPSLSSKPSIASFKGPRAGYMVPSSDIPPMMLADPNDKWANLLGHANFTILPEPYVPEVCNAYTVKLLMDDWQQARNNYAKHQVRTAEHYGATSKYYPLTEQKWAEIDAEWKKAHDLAKATAVAIGQELEPTSPTEPEPLSKMPTLNDPKSQGKFPKLGDEDIVGPMFQFKESPLFQKPPSRKRAFFKFLSDLRFPGSLLGRSSGLGVRSH